MKRQSVIVVIMLVSLLTIYSCTLNDNNCCKMAGNVNSDGMVGISDLTFLVDFVNQIGVKPECLKEADVNNDCQVDTLDFNYLVDYMFNNGPAPVCGCAEEEKFRTNPYK